LSIAATFWLKIEKFWPFEEISIFSNSGHLEWRAWLSDTILKGTHPGTIPARFGDFFMFIKFWRYSTPDTHSEIFVL
jgi:hypothetical protein